jgi:hypothetical protein
METFICTACGTQYAPSAAPPARCEICSESRQYVPYTGQGWTIPAKLALTHSNAFRRLAPDLYSIATQPAFAIGQRALLLRTPAGNVLWDCIALLDAATVDIVRALGGLSAIAISHPHYYTTQVDWAREFGCPVWLHADDREWVMRDDAALRYWEGDTHALAGGAALARLGGHFAGGTVLHWANGAGGRGIVLSGDVLQVVADRRHVSFMWSYPNFIPLPASQIRQIAARLAPFTYDAVYGGFVNAEITQGAQAAVAESVRRYLSMLETGTLNPSNPERP